MKLVLTRDPPKLVEYHLTRGMRARARETIFSGKSAKSLPPTCETTFTNIRACRVHFNESWKRGHCRPDRTTAAYAYVPPTSLECPLAATAAL